MDFRPTTEQALLKNTARKLAEERFRPSAFKWKGEYPEANGKILREQDFYGVSLPQEYGGGGLTLVEELLILEEVGRGLPGHTFCVDSQRLPADHRRDWIRETQTEIPSGFLP